MAITGSTVTANQSLEEFRVQFNNLVSDVSQLESNPTYGSSLIFEGATDDAFETTFTVSDPSADRTVTVPDASGTILLTGASSFAVADGGTLGSSTTADAMKIASDGVVTFAAAPSLTEIDSASTITLDAETDITLDAKGGDIFFKDNGTLIGTFTNNGGNLVIKNGSTAAITFSGANSTFAGNVLVADGGNVGSASSTSAITIASTGIVTFVDDILIKDAGTIGSASDPNAIGISSGGVVSVTATTANTSASDGALTVAGGLGVAADASVGDDLRLISDAAVLSFGANSEITVTHVHDTGLNFKHTATADDKPIVLTLQTGETDIAADDVIGKIAFQAPDEGEGTDATLVSAAIQAVAEGDFSSSSNATTLDFMTGSSEAAASKMKLNSAGVLTLSASTASSSKTTGALVVTGGIGTSADLYVGDLLNVEGGINIAGSNQELRFYEGANYVGFEAPALSADQIWVLPAADGSDGNVLVTDGSGTTSWSSAVSGVAGNITISANNSANETVYPVFVDGATGGQGLESDTGLTYNPSTGILTSTKFNGTLTGNVVVANDGNIGSVGDEDSVAIDSSGNWTFSQNLTVTGVTTLNGNLVLGDAAADTLTIGATLAGGSPLVFEGATADGHELTFTITDPTADRTITFPNETGTVHTSGGTTTHTAILIADGGNIGSASDTNAIGISSGGVVSVTATTASTSATTGALTVAGGAGVAADLGVGDDLFMISDGAAITFGANSEIALTHVHDTGLSVTSTAAAPLVRRGEDVFIVLDGTNSASANAGDNIVQDTSANDGDDILGEDEVFIHAGMQRNVINIICSDGKIKNSVAGFAPGAI